RWSSSGSIGKSSSSNWSNMSRGYSFDDWMLLIFGLQMTLYGWVPKVGLMENIGNSWLTEAASVLGYRVGKVPFMYLGLPIGVGPRRLLFWVVAQYGEAAQLNTFSFLMVFAPLWNLVRSWIGISSADPEMVQEHLIQFTHCSRGPRARRSFM
ncbi:cysteine-rich receptor-like protein kinase, partial [Trifolium pratense]